MVRKIFLLLCFLYTLVNASVYEDNCVKCHKEDPEGIDKYFYNYLLIYSGERDTKNAIISYLNYPAKETSIISDEEISKFGIKKKTTLNQEQLKEAVDIYWEKYKVFGKLK
jgi:hypothetical protein